MLCCPEGKLILSIILWILKWHETIVDQDLTDEYSYCHCVDVHIFLNGTYWFNGYLFGPKPKQLKANYEKENIPAVIEKEIKNTFKRIKIALIDVS